jgi:DNA-binding response OmpR family regulator
MNAPQQILVVEDDTSMSSVMEKRLTNKGFSVTHAANGEEALTHMKAQRFDWILLDLLMPVKDGFAVLKEKTDTLNAQTKVCVLTCLGEEETLQKAKNMGAELCFIKSQTSLSQVIKALQGGAA